MAKNSVIKIFGGENGNQFLVHAYNIITTDVWVVRAFEKTDGYTSEKHGTISSFNDVIYGDVATRRSNCKLPSGDERAEIVRAHYRKADKDARELIFAVFPTISQDLTCWNRVNDCADIELHGETFNHVPVENPQVNVEIW